MAVKQRKTRQKRSGLTAKQESFAQNYVKTRNASEAYRAAYKAAKMADKTVWEAASRLMADSKVKARVAELDSRAKEIANTKFDISMEEIIYRLKLLGCASLKDYMRIDAEGEPTIDFTDTTDEQFYALNEVTVEDIETGQRVGKRTKIKMADRISALVKLGQHKGGFRVGLDANVAGKNGGPLQVVISPADANL